MKVLVIPDVHLKPWMFRRASELMKTTGADRAVCLMDIADDWGKQYEPDLYAQAYDAAIEFAKEYADTLWCYGNHELCYLWDQRETGYSGIAAGTVCEKLSRLREVLPEEGQIAFLHMVDSVIFSHGGLSCSFARRYVPSGEYHDAAAAVRRINRLGCTEMWQDASPIWFRPQYGGRLYSPEKILHIAGHTPVTEITRSRGLISCDVFSTDRTGRPIGTQEYLYLDTISWEYTGIR